MNSNVAGLIWSILFILTILAFVAVLKKTTKINDEILRKIVHIGVSNWWLINLHFKLDMEVVIIAPLVFMFLNAFAIMVPKVGEIFGFVGKKRNYGLIYYPFSISVLLYLCYSGYLPFYAGTIGVLCMGYGDGFAAITGTLWGNKKISLKTGGKTYLGSFVMAVVCNLVCVFTFALSTSFGTLQIIIASLIISIVSALVEMLTPLGLDNVSVPLIAAVLAGAIL